MNFVDLADVSVIAGKGGDGKISFRHERFVSKGGPDGGDGGDGGDVVFAASNDQNSLAMFRYTKQLKAESGQPGGNKRKHGKNGRDLIVNVPVGTVAKAHGDEVIADLTEDGEIAIIALGGKGGYGNAHFVNSHRQAPNFAEKGEPGESFNLVLELKMLADVGLVGLPNAGKSTLLRSISNARPKVANYPFTTLSPSVGVVDVDDGSSLLFADIPGLIEGAAKGKGLGHDFLRHIERTAVILHVIDAYVDNIADAYIGIRQELGAYSRELTRRPEIIAITKTEGLDNEIITDLVAGLRRVVRRKSTPILVISAHSGQGLKELVFAAKRIRDKVLMSKSAKSEADVYEYRLPGGTTQAWQVKRVGARSFKVTGKQIERFATRTDFNNDQAVARLMDILKRRGVLHELSRQGINPGDKIILADKGEITY